MRRYGIFLATGLLALVNAIVLGGVAYNRSGTSDATITLTERELPLGSYYGYAKRENTGLALRLDWSQGHSRYGRHLLKFGSYYRNNPYPGWFDKAKLESLGFDCTMPLDDPRAGLYYQKMLPRKTFAVLEYEGKAWEAWQAEEKNWLDRMEEKVATGEVSRKQLVDAQAEYERETRTCSRLFAVDVGNDPVALRNLYGDRGRFLILPAKVALSYYKPGIADDDFSKAPWQLSGRVMEILDDEIYVPREHRSGIENVLRKNEQMRTSEYSPYGERKRTPAYTITLHVGKRYEPWIADVNMLAIEPVK